MSRYGLRRRRVQAGRFACFGVREAEGEEQAGGEQRGELAEGAHLEQVLKGARYCSHK